MTSNIWFPVCPRESVGSTEGVDARRSGMGRLCLLLLHRRGFALGD
jgi:hypothetical protein